MVLVQKWPFFQLFFLGNVGEKNVFYVILERKKAFLGYKNKMFQKSKNSHFSTHGFGQKMAIFRTFLFYAIQARKMSFTLFQNKKTPFQPIKTTSSQGRKINIFAKGLAHGFGTKMAIFPSFFFKQYRRGKCLVGYSRTKKRLPRQ